MSLREPYKEEQLLPVESGDKEAMTTTTTPDEATRLKEGCKYSSDEAFALTLLCACGLYFQGRYLAAVTTALPICEALLRKLYSAEHGHQLNLQTTPVRRPNSPPDGEVVYVSFQEAIFAQLIKQHEKDSTVFTPEQVELIRDLFTPEEGCSNLRNWIDHGFLKDVSQATAAKVLHLVDMTMCKVNRRVHPRLRLFLGNENFDAQPLLLQERRRLQSVFDQIVEDLEVGPQTLPVCASWFERSKVLSHLEYLASGNEKLMASLRDDVSAFAVPCFSLLSFSVPLWIGVMQKLRPKLRALCEGKADASAKAIAAVVQGMQTAWRGLFAPLSH